MIGIVMCRTETSHQRFFTKKKETTNEATLFQIFTGYLVITVSHLYLNDIYHILHGHFFKNIHRTILAK